MVLTLLGITLIGFFFTLGLHYGKKIRPEHTTAEATPQKMEESPEVVPSRETLDEGSQHVEGAAQEAIQQATEHAVKESGIKVENPRPVHLPTEKKNSTHEEKTEVVEEAPASDVPRFAVQLGSYPNRKDANAKIIALGRRGLHTEVRTAIVNGETRFRVVIPGFKNRKSADLRGKELRAHHKIDNYVVIKGN